MSQMHLSLTREVKAALRRESADSYLVLGATKPGLTVSVSTKTSLITLVKQWLAAGDTLPVAGGTEWPPWPQDNRILLHPLYSARGISRKILSARQNLENLSVRTTVDLRLERTIEHCGAFQLMTPHQLTPCPVMVGNARVNLVTF